MQQCLFCLNLVAVATPFAPLNILITYLNSQTSKPYYSCEKVCWHLVQSWKQCISGLFLPKFGCYGNRPCSPENSDSIFELADPKRLLRGGRVQSFERLHIWSCTGIQCHSASGLPSDTSWAVHGATSAGLRKRQILHPTSAEADDASSCAVNLDNIADDEEGCFTVPSEIKPGHKYVVDIATGICSCFTGSSGVLCKHMSAVMCKVESSITVAPGLKVANKDSRSLMFEVATAH